MKKTVYFDEFSREMEDQYTNEGKRALFDYLETLEAVLETPIDFDDIMIRSNYHEESLSDIIGSYDICVNEEDDELLQRKVVRNFLKNRTNLIAELSNGNFLFEVF